MESGSTALSRGFIRRELIREKEIDKIKVQECFVPGDVVRTKFCVLRRWKEDLLIDGRGGLGGCVREMRGQWKIDASVLMDPDGVPKDWAQGREEGGETQSELTDLCIQERIDGH